MTTDMADSLIAASGNMVISAPMKLYILGEYLALRSFPPTHGPAQGSAGAAATNNVARTVPDELTFLPPSLNNNIIS